MAILNYVGGADNPPRQATSFATQSVQLVDNTERARRTRTPYLLIRRHGRVVRPGTIRVLLSCRWRCRGARLSSSLSSELSSGQSAKQRHSHRFLIPGDPALTIGCVKAGQGPGAGGAAAVAVRRTEPARDHPPGLSRRAAGVLSTIPRWPTTAPANARSCWPRPNKTWPPSSRPPGETLGRCAGATRSPYGWAR